MAKSSVAAAGVKSTKLPKPLGCGFLFRSKVPVAPKRRRRFPGREEAGGQTACERRTFHWTTSPIFRVEILRIYSDRLAHGLGNLRLGYALTRRAASVRPLDFRRLSQIRSCLFCRYKRSIITGNRRFQLWLRSLEINLWKIYSLPN
jgi:hypothetical protein